jgi:hydroxypyruvate reductase
MNPEAQIEAWFREVLAQLDPALLTSRATSFRDDADFPLFGEPVYRNPVQVPVEGELVVIAIGKAAIGMAAGAQIMFGDRFQRGYVLTVDGPDESALDDRWTVYRAGHPIPDQRGIDAARAIIQVVDELQPDDLVVVLLSGGGSALFEAPREPMTLDDFAEITRMLLNAGAPIQHLNTVRIPLSQVKGGAFRRRSPAGQFATFILSDVLGNQTQIIASGPTVKPATTGAAALAVLDIYGLRETVPSVVRTALNEAAAEVPEWDYPDDIVELVGDVELAMELAGAVTREAGLSTVVPDFLLEGDATDMARNWVEELLALDDDIDVIWTGGENTVTVTGNGTGGRNTEFALAAALELDRLENDEWVVASLATDGQDGSSGSAGAIASRETIRRARQLGIDPATALANNDSATFFRETGGLVITGPTGTNVNDLYVGLRKRPG